MTTGSGEMKRLAEIHGITQSGLCVHNAENFAGWHRIYLLDLEVQLQAADRTLGGDGCVALPYWDTGRTTINNQVMPNIIRTNFVNNPDSTVLNFFEAECQRAYPGYSCSRLTQFNVWGGCSLVSADGTTGLPCTNDETTLANNIIDSDITGRVGNLMSITSHQGAAGGGGFSVEQPHNHVHMDVGWPMSSFLHAPFNPIFFLHHCNIDRLYEVWLQANPNARNGVSSAVLNEAYAPFNVKLHGSDKGTAYTYTLADVWSTPTLGYTYDSLHTTSAEAELLTSAAGKTEIVFTDVDFHSLDSMMIEVAVTKKGETVPLAALVGKSLTERREVYGSKGKWCGHIGIFSMKGKGGMEDVDVDCTAGISAMGGTESVDITYYCVTGEKGMTVEACGSKITTPPVFIANWHGYTSREHTAHTH